MMLSWVYTCAMVVKSIVYEKEQRLKETMHVMGLGNGVHWLGWAIDSILPMMFTILLLTFILTHGQILRSADPTLIYVLLLMYCVATIAQSFLISVFFSRANLAAASGGIIFFVLYLPYPFMVRWMTILPPYIKAIMCLSSNVAFGVATSYLAFYEEQGTGAQWADIGSSPLHGDQFNLLYVIYLLLIDTGIYLLLTWYLEAVMPGMYGVPKPWYFPFTSSYWCGTTKGVTDINVLRTGSVAHENCESEPSQLKQGITIQSLSKVYSNGKLAVRDLSLNFYEGHITSFLGHNGAGKTSTISMLTGLLPPSSGTAKIYGMDIRTDMDAIRKSMGMCPQHNVLFNLLTVEEHLWLYARLRGAGGGAEAERSVEAECDAMIVDLGLADRRHCLASQLSGGMQRKLSVAIAFIGQSKTVILDEPTSGVDPYSRRSIWELLTKYKKGRTVVLTTHYMDEADILGDRIAIIAHGQLQCCGSSLYLKNRFGSGYYLTIDMREDKISSGLSSPEIKKITNHIKEIVPSAKFHEHIGTELIYVLAHCDVERFNKLFSFLEDFKADLFINSYGISDTSLEEIFLRVGSQADDAVGADDETGSKSCLGKLSSAFRKKKTSSSSCAHRTKEQPENDSLPQGNGSVVKYTSVPVMDDDGENIKPEGRKHWRQFLALHVKRFHHTRRNRKAIFSELILPGLFVCMALLVTSIVPRLQQRPPLTLAPSVYAPPHYTFASLNATSAADWQTSLDANLTGPLGLGTACLSNQRSYDASCAGKTYDSRPGQLNVSSFGAPCSCKTGAHLCPSQPDRPVPPSLKLSSHDILFNLTGSNTSDWILKTWKQYEKTRMGGYSMGFESPVPVVEFKSVNASASESSQNSYIDIRYKANNVKVWFNNKGWASSVSYLNAINNVILRSSVPAHAAHQYGIRAVNHPMNFTEKQMNIELIKESGKSLLHAISVLFALSFVPASFLVYLIEDKVTSSKHLQMASGVNRLIYWLQAYTWDMCCYLLSAGLCVFIFLVFNEQNYVSSRNLAGFVILLAFYGWSIIPLMYPASFVFSVPSFAFVGLACANIFIGVITTVTTFVLGVFEDEDLRAVDAVLKEVFLIFPHFCLGDGLMKLAANHIYYFALQQYIDVEVKNEIFKWDYLGKNLTCMFLSGIFYFLLTLFLEFRSLPFWSCSSGGSYNVVEDGLNKEDEDVRAERIRINQNPAIDDILVIKNLTKVYSRSKEARPAVNQVCAGIKRGECFGLLGLNGAGKTTTFKMLTGAMRPSGGDALIGGSSVRGDVDAVRAQLGYCPQFDALDPLLTPREHLVFYARLRNIPSRQLQSVVDASLIKLGLGHYSDRCAGTLSGGNKRKLSTAIAVLGNPPVIFLDEPTSGMDPRARRFLWSCVRRLTREAGRSVVLTSHSMEECQALCTRLTVMVNGRFKCLGSSQHLKNKFGGGYSLSLHCSDSSSSGDQVADVKNFISSRLPDATLQEHHHTRLRYQLVSSLLATVFQVMEEARSTGLILDYSLSQTTLEDVFLQFASEQGEADEDMHTRHARPAVIRNCFKCCASNGGA